MGKIGAAIGAGIIAIYVFVQVFTGLGGTIPGMDGPGDASSFAEGPQMRGCLRNLAKEGASEAQARDTCGCMFREFDKRGLSLWDAANEDNFAMMSEITRDCAAVHGLDVPPLGGSGGDSDWG
ncbi:hypothetical protein [Altererythrobacter sp. MF3-039]|uniref:hypothetical protein n=1 Tax=Altererythrobacter sp. MF3-039 TaxID=3252901 RepID=UPI00390C5BD1